MDLKINNHDSFRGFYQATTKRVGAVSSDIIKSMYSTLDKLGTDVIEHDSKVIVKNPKTGLVYEVMPFKPQYGYNSGYRIIEYPVIVNGKFSTYPIHYQFPQNHISRVGGEMAAKNSREIQLISAREIAKDIEKNASA